MTVCAIRGGVGRLGGSAHRGSSLHRGARRTPGRRAARTRPRARRTPCRRGGNDRPRPCRSRTADRRWPCPPPGRGHRSAPSGCGCWTAAPPRAAGGGWTRSPRREPGQEVLEPAGEVRAVGPVEQVVAADEDRARPRSPPAGPSVQERVQQGDLLLEHVGQHRPGRRQVHHDEVASAGGQPCLQLVHPAPVPAPSRRRSATSSRRGRTTAVRATRRRRGCARPTPRRTARRGPARSGRLAGHGPGRAAPCPDRVRCGCRR